MNGCKNISEIAVLGADRTKALFGTGALFPKQPESLLFYRMFKIESKQKDIAVFGAGCFGARKRCFKI